MTFLKAFASVIFVSLTVCTAVAQKGAAITSKDLKHLIGCWQGTLTYNGTVVRKPHSTTAELVIKQMGKSKKFHCLYTYTKEPNDTSSDNIIISKDGKKLNAASVKTRRHNRKGELEIITESKGVDHDNNKPAIFRTTYIIGKNIYTCKKEVQLDGEIEWMEREEFKYSRKPCR